MAPHTQNTKKINGQPSFTQSSGLSAIATPKLGNNLNAKSLSSVAPNKSAHVPHAAHQHNGPLVPLPHCRFHAHEVKCKSTSHLSTLRRTTSAGARAFKPAGLHARTKSLQNTLGGTNITSATPVGLSSHMDPKALAVAAGIGATTFAPMGNTDDGTAERQYSYETEVQRERSMSDGQEYYGEEAPVEEERFVSDLMEATTIGENHHKLQYTTSEPYNHGTGQYTPLLEKDPLELAVQQPRVVQYQKQPEIRFPLTKQDANLACQLNLGDINNYSLQRGNNDGTFCYSILLIVGVLLMGVGIVLYILQALLGYKALESIIGGIMFLTGVVVLICSMMGWKRRASHNEKKMIQV